MFGIERDPTIHLTNERLRKLGVKAALFDLDDTLIDTDLLFSENMRNFAESVALSFELDSLDVLKRLRELNIEEYQRHGIDPDKWNVVLQRLGQELGNEFLVMKNFELIRKIYISEPRLFSGVKQLLGGLREGGFLLGEVTHAETDWSVRKNSQTGIINYFDVIVTVGVRGTKTKESWKHCMDELEVLPSECIITGDNIRGDIIPAVELGARALCLPSPFLVYREGEIPEGVVKMEKISDFWDAVTYLK